MVPAFPQMDQQQKLRFRRALMAAGSYLMWMGIALYFYSRGALTRIPFGAILVLFAIMTVYNLGLLLFIRSGYNRHLKDPSLTLIQMVVASVWAMLFVYYADESRGALLLLYLVVFVFGFFKLRMRQFITLAGMAVISYCLVLYLLYLRHPELVNPKAEVLNVIVLSLVLTWFSLVGGYITNLRNKVAKAMARIEQLAIHDDLTGVFNRRQLYTILDREKALADRGNHSFSICIFDLDDFKQINDTRGHETGDLVLRTVAQAVQQSLRTVDCIARYGGEEFILVLPNAGSDDAGICAERVRSLVEQLVFACRPDPLQVTISLGVAEHRFGESVAETIRRADKALYHAKASGKNRVAFDPPVRAVI
ncbi:MAG: GGDEF domain-containing protein [Thermodesulfobacteriota bacterium]